MGTTLQNNTNTGPAIIMATKLVICIGVLIAAIEAYPQFVAVPIEEYQALKYGQPIAQSRSLFAANNVPLVRHRRSTSQSTPLVLRPQQPFRKQVAPRSDYSFEPQRQYRPQQYAASVRKEVFVKPERRLQQQYAPRPVYRPRQQYEASVQNEVVVQPFNGGYDGTPQYSPEQVVYVEEPSYDLAQGASQTHEKRDAGYGGGGGDDHVDYGAYTGSYGAFGWYSDHPVCLDCGGGYH